MIHNACARKTTSLNGRWRIIIDSYENGYYDYRYQPQTAEGYFANRKPASKSDRVEYDFDQADTLDVPGDWNSQRGHGPQPKPGTLSGVRANRAAR
jgi:beta-glucuronidase